MTLIRTGTVLSATTDQIVDRYQSVKLERLRAVVRVYVTKHTTKELMWEDYVLEVTLGGTMDGFEVRGREIGEKYFKPLFVNFRGRVYKESWSYDGGIVGNIHIESV